MQSNRLKQVAPDIEIPDEASPTPPEDGSASLDLLFLALKSLSQRALVALNGMFVLIAVASVFALFFSIRDNPSNSQLILAGVYGAFVLAVVALKRR